MARKGAAGENFPVASRLLPRRLRPHVHAFYALVRLADDIADDPLMEPESKLHHLDALERALVTGRATAAYLQPALALRASLRTCGLPDIHARQLLQAFRHDVEVPHCRTWPELYQYCRLSAMPVGRHVLALHGEGEAPIPAADALCAALQILNHLQDCREDWIQLGRCYLPLTWFDEAGVTPERLVETRSDPTLRAVFDRTLDHAEALLAQASVLPALVQHRRLRLEAAVILSLARALASRLRQRDPLAGRVALAGPAKLLAVGRGLLTGVIAP